jgi:hypothetical protein
MAVSTQSEVEEQREQQLAKDIIAQIAHYKAIWQALADETFVRIVKYVPRYRKMMERVLCPYDECGGDYGPTRGILMHLEAVMERGSDLDMQLAEFKRKPYYCDAAPEVTNIDMRYAGNWWGGSTDAEALVARLNEHDADGRYVVCKDPVRWQRSEHAVPFGNRSDFVYESWDNYGNRLMRVYLPTERDVLVPFTDKFGATRYAFCTSIERNNTYRIEWVDARTKDAGSTDQHYLIVRCFKNEERTYRSGKKWRTGTETWNRAITCGSGDRLISMPAMEEATALITASIGMLLTPVKCGTTLPTQDSYNLGTYDDAPTAFSRKAFRQAGVTYPSKSRS